MNKKKLMVMLVALTLIAAMGVGATLAYFTDTTELTNVVTMGKVEGKLVEHNVYQDFWGNWKLDGFKPRTETGIDYYEGIMPGDWVEKDPTVILADRSADAYVRVYYDVQINRDVENKDELINMLKNNIDKEISRRFWTYDGSKYYYLRNKLSKFNEAKLFDKFQFPASFNSDVAGEKFSIIVRAELIQADNIKFKEDINYFTRESSNPQWLGSDNEEIEDIMDYPITANQSTSEGSSNAQ